MKAARRTTVLFALASLLFGGTFVAAKAGLDYFPPLLFVALRFDVAAVALIAYAVATTPRERLVPRTRDDVVGILATGVLAIGLTNALLFVGQQHATIAPTAPVFAAVLLADERLSARGGAGLALGLVGVGLVVSPDPANLLAGGVGKAILFAGAVSGALGSVLIRRADGRLDSTVRTAWGLPIAAGLSHLLSLAAGESPAAITWSSEALVALAYVGLLAGAVAYIAYFGLLDDVGAIRANLTFYVVPAVATLGGWALLAEAIAPTAVAGFLTIFAGFAVLGSREIDLTAVRDRLLGDPAVQSDDDTGGFGSGAD